MLAASILLPERTQDPDAAASPAASPPDDSSTSPASDDAPTTAADSPGESDTPAESASDAAASALQNVASAAAASDDGSPQSDAAASDSSSDSDTDDDAHEDTAQWSLRMLRHCTLVTSLLFLLFGTAVWLFGLKLFRASAASCCALLLSIWAMATGNTLLAAWTAEAGMANQLSMDADGGDWGLDLATPSGAATLAALSSGIGGIGLIAWLIAASQPVRHAPKVVALVWGMLLGTILHTSAVAWLLDTSAPITLAWTMHATLVLCCILCCALTLLHMVRHEKIALVVATAGCGAWALVRGGVMLILLIEVGSAADDAQSGVQPNEVGREWKWPNEWNLPLLDMHHPQRVADYDALASDPSFASSVPYSSLVSSVTQDDIRLNVRASYYAYLALITVLFGAGVAIQGARNRRRPILPLFFESQNGSRRGSHAHLLGGGPHRKSASITPDPLPFSADSKMNGGSGGGGANYGSNMTYPRASQDDLGTSFGGGGHGGRSRRGVNANGSYSGASGGGQDHGPFVPRTSRSVSTSPLRPSLVPSRSTPSKSGSGGSSGTKRPSGSKDWSRRTSFTLSVRVDNPDTTHGNGNGGGGHHHVSRSPSAPSLTDVEGDSLLLYAPHSVPVSRDSGGSGSGTNSAGGSGSAKGSLKKMRQAALAIKGTERKKKSISFLDDISGLGVAPQRTPEAPEDTQVRSASPLPQYPSTAIGGLSGAASVPPLEGSPDLPQPITPAWSPFPHVEQYHLDEWNERERHTREMEAAAREAQAHL